jgi:hypothetical protein
VLTSRTDLFVFSVETSLLVTRHYLTAPGVKNTNSRTMVSWFDGISSRIMVHSPSIVLHRLMSFSSVGVVGEELETPIEAGVVVVGSSLSVIISFPQVVIQ